MSNHFKLFNQFRSNLTFNKNNICNFSNMSNFNNMNNNFMNPGMNIDRRNSCVLNFDFIPINAMPCMQQNFCNLGRNMNNLNYNNITPKNHMININSINNQNNYDPLRTFH